MSYTDVGAIVKGGAKGSTSRAEVTSTSVDANTQGLDVVVKSGGGGAVTVADGADVAQGATSDADTASTTIGLLKKIKSLLSGSLAVTGTFWPATQPVSGSVTANAGTNLNTSALALDATLTGGTAKSKLYSEAKAAYPSVGITGEAINANINALHVLVENAAISTNDPGLPDTLGQKTMALSTGVVLASDQASVPVAATLAAETTKVIGTVNVSAGQTIGVTGTFWQATQPVSLPKSATAAVTSVADTAASVQLLASTPGRLGATFYNNSTQALYLKFGTTASATDFTIKIAADGYYELPTPVIYTGRIDGIWAADSTGAVLITELT